MSVFTEISTQELRAFLTGYDCGQLLGYSAISGGTDNSNYRVATDRGRFVLTLLERVDPATSEFAVRVARHLAAHGVPCAAPVTARDGHTFHTIKNKRALLSPYLPGRSVLDPNPENCAQVGAALAHIHLAARDFPERRVNPFGARWLQRIQRQIAPSLSDAQQALFEQQLRASLHADTDLPLGVIHGDLFRDNVLFDAGEISGIIDWYYACTDYWLMDVAIAVNDWCRSEDGVVVPRMTALCSAYGQQRPFTPAERDHWPQFLCTAALRFWASRLLDERFPRAGRGLPDKPAREMEALLRYHAAVTAVPLP